MEFSDFQSFMMVLLSACAAIAAVSGACAAIVKFWRYAHKQSDDNSSTLRQMESYLASDKRRIENLEHKQDRAEELNRMQLEALVTLISHEIDGNHTQQLTDMQKKINGYLYDKAVSE